MLRSFCVNHPDDWYNYLAQTELAINCFPHTSTGQSPHKIVYGTDIKLPVDACIATSVPEVEHTVRKL